jgi:hypothetical protein
MSLIRRRITTMRFPSIQRNDVLWRSTNLDLDSRIAIVLLEQGTATRMYAQVYDLVYVRVIDLI